MASDLRGKMQRMSELLDRIEELSKTVAVPTTFQAVGAETMTISAPVGISDFVRLAYADGWMMLDFDWPAWEEGREIAGSPERIAECDLDTIHKLITALVRSDRFCEGALASAWQHGSIEAILQRIRTLMKMEE
jgi:hypothetical protein